MSESTSGDPFSDEAAFGSRVTGIKIRYTATAIDFIQVELSEISPMFIATSNINFQAFYDGYAGPINGGTEGPGSNIVFNVPEGTEIVSASVWLKRILTT